MYFVRSANLGLGGNEQKMRLEKAAGLMRPLATAPNASRRARRIYADVLNYLSHTQSKEEGIASCEESSGSARTDLSAASAYGDVSDSEARHALDLGRLDEAERLEQEVYKLSGQVLVKRPGDLRAMADRWYGPNVLSTVAAQRLDFVSAIEYARMALQAGDDYVRFNPADSLGWQLWSESHNQISGDLLQLGHVQEAIDQAHAGTELEHDPRNGSGIPGNIYYCWANLARWESMRGNREAAEKALQESRRSGALLLKKLQLGPDFARLVLVGDAELETRMRLLRMEYAAAYASASQALADAKNWPQGPAWQKFRDDLAQGFQMSLVESAMQLGQTRDAEAAGRALLESQVEQGKHSNRKEEIARAQVMLAQAIANQGRASEARRMVDPAIAYYRGRQRLEGSGTEFTGRLARALYVQALTEPNDANGHVKAQAALAEASGLLEGLSGEVKELRPIRDLTGWISAALTKLGL